MTTRARRFIRLATAAAAWLMLLGSVAPVVDAWQHALETTPAVDAHCVICDNARAPEPRLDAARTLPLPDEHRYRVALPADERALTAPVDRSPPRTRAPPA